jgi:hypothetical protein
VRTILFYVLVCRLLRLVIDGVMFAVTSFWVGDVFVLVIEGGIVLRGQGEEEIWSEGIGVSHLDFIL